MASVINPFRVIDRLLNEIKVGDVSEEDEIGGDETDFYAGDMSDSTPLFLDPEPSEMSSANKDRYLGGVITTNHVWIWNRHYAQHDDVRKRFERAQKFGIEELLGPKPSKDRVAPYRYWTLAFKTLKADGLIEPVKPYKFQLEKNIIPVYFDLEREPQKEPDAKLAQKNGWGTQPKPVLRFRYSSWSDVVMRHQKEATRKVVEKVLAKHPFRKEYILRDVTSAGAGFKYNTGYEQEDDGRWVPRGKETAR